MAEIPPANASLPTGGAVSSAQAPSAGLGYGAYGGGQQQKRRSPLRHVFADIASVLGIPERKLTPEVQAALNSMVAEMDRLRSEIEQRDQRMHWLEEQADKHAWLACLNRRAFMRELTRLKEYSERSGIAGSLARFDILTCDALRHQHGLVAYDALLSQVAETLITHVRQTDVLGCVGGPCLAAVMPQATEPQAIHKLGSVMDHASMRVFEWQGERIPIEIAWKVQGFVPGETADEAFKRCEPVIGFSSG
ncbi:MAG: diguanylate cyclase [Alphaproteobacteria bacterium]|nr:diguanylate cyclase [Alphaproteobacteria bacterium]